MDFGDLLDYLASDPDTRAILMYADVHPGADRGPGPGVLRAPGQLRDQAGLADPGGGPDE